jgi:hypothetical protein
VEAVFGFGREWCLDEHLDVYKELLVCHLGLSLFLGNFSEYRCLLELYEGRAAASASGGFGGGGGLTDWADFTMGLGGV